jgi:hypothetical protein
MLLLVHTTGSGNPASGLGGASFGVTSLHAGSHVALPPSGDAEHRCTPHVMPGAHAPPSAVLQAFPSPA